MALRIKSHWHDDDADRSLEEIAGGSLTGTVNTTPFVMGQIALQVVMDSLNGDFGGGFVETPTVVVDGDNVLPALQDPDSLYPKPSKAY